METSPQIRSLQCFQPFRDSGRPRMGTGRDEQSLRRILFPPAKTFRATSKDLLKQHLDLGQRQVALLLQHPDTSLDKRVTNVILFLRSHLIRSTEDSSSMPGAQPPHQTVFGFHHLLWRKCLQAAWIETAVDPQPVLELEVFLLDAQ